MTPEPSLTSKAFWYGTHRTSAPSETLDRFGSHAGELGITRLANVTGLDYLEIPVFMAIRPNARSLTVAQGKGLDQATARTSAFMEAVERAHGELVEQDVIKASLSELGAVGRVVDPARLPRVGRKKFQRDQKISWIIGKDLVSGEETFVPFEAVHIDFTMPVRAGRGCLLSSSNGLASGNVALEAICAALCEVIERDALGLWRVRENDDRARRRLILHSVTHADCRALLTHLTSCGMTVTVWDLTSDIAIPCFLARICEAPENTRSNFGSFWGSGAHLSREIAFTRAVTEAVQSRLTYIVGSRDDLHLTFYEETEAERLLSFASDLVEMRAKSRRFEDVLSITCQTFEEDVAYLLTQLRSAGLDKVIVIDLTQDQFGIPVVRIIVPGLEVDGIHSRCLPGRRARALARSPQ